MLQFVANHKHHITGTLRMVQAKCLDVIAQEQVLNTVIVEKKDVMYSSQPEPVTHTLIV